MLRYDLAVVLSVPFGWPGMSKRFNLTGRQRFAIITRSTYSNRPKAVLSGSPWALSACRPEKLEANAREEIRMPVIDSSAFTGSDALPGPLQCDVCIIGTGPAGSTIARELSGTTLRVTILESGGVERQEEADALNEIESVTLNAKSMAYTGCSSREAPFSRLMANLTRRR